MSQDKLEFTFFFLSFTVSVSDAVFFVCLFFTQNPLIIVDEKKEKNPKKIPQKLSFVLPVESMINDYIKKLQNSCLRVMYRLHSLSLHSMSMPG